MMEVLLVVIAFILFLVYRKLSDTKEKLFGIHEDIEKINDGLEGCIKVIEETNKEIFQAKEELSRDINHFRKLSGARTEKEREDFLFEISHQNKDK